MEMKKYNIVDLSYPIKSDMLVYPGTERPVFKWAGRINSEGFNLTKMWMHTHTGTHADAPNHFIENAKSIDELSIDCFFGRAKLFRYNQEPKSQNISPDEIISSEHELEPEIIFVLETGIERHSEKKEYNELFPVPSQDLLELLIEYKIRAYMTDATSVDRVNSKGSPNHHLLLGAGVPIVENLCNLSKIPVNKFFTIIALPLKLEGREGSPCRAVALLDLDIARI
jgi:kynurenine formamidase